MGPPLLPLPEALCDLLSRCSLHPNYSFLGIVLSELPCASSLRSLAYLNSARLTPCLGKCREVQENSGKCRERQGSAGKFRRIQGNAGKDWEVQNSGIRSKRRVEHTLYFKCATCVALLLGVLPCARTSLIGNLRGYALLLPSKF
jgi:hypothetical protein